MKDMLINNWGEETRLNFRKTHYANNGADAVQIVYWDEDFKAWAPFCFLTVNLSEPIEQGYAYIDSDCPQQIIDILTDRGYLDTPIKYTQSGWNNYGLYDIRKLLYVIEEM